MNKSSILGLFCPIFEHVKEAWEIRHHPNMLFMFYEEFSKVTIIPSYSCTHKSLKMLSKFNLQFSSINKINQEEDSYDIKSAYYILVEKICEL